MHRYWSDHPPVHLMVAAYLGIEPKQRYEDNDAALEALLGMLGIADGGSAGIG